MEPKTKRLLFGCLGGCGLMLVLVIGSCVSFSIWLKSPGEVLNPELLLGSDTTGYLEWTLELEDPGTAEFVESAIRSINRMNDRTDSPLPDGLAQLLRRQQAKSTDRDIKRFLPLVVAATVRPSAEPNEDEHLFSISAGGITRQMMLLDWVIGFVLSNTDEVRTVRHDGEKIHVFPETRYQPAVFVRKGIVFVATDLDSARQALDRLAQPVREQAVNDSLNALLAGLDRSQRLRGALTNRRGELLRLLELLEMPIDQQSRTRWDEVRGVTLVAGFLEREIFAGTMELHGPDAAWANAQAPVLGAALASTLDRSGMEFATETRAVGNRIQVEFSTTELLEKIERGLGPSLE